MTIVSVYAALLALLFIALSFNVIRVRRATNTALGDAGDARLLRAMRVHANFAEYVPLALILLFAAAGLGAGAIWLHLLGALLLAGRVSHAWGVARTPENLRALGEDIAAGRIVFPVVATYPLDDVVAAFQALESSHDPGKIVVLP